MISKNDLINYAKKKNYNLGQAEKNYYQEIILFILYQHFGLDLVFKGGTALTKCYGLDRFSEDLDFFAKKEENFNQIITKGLNDFYLEYEVEEKKHKESIDLTYYIKGPLYNGQKNSMCKILLDISLRGELLFEPVTKKIGLFVEEIPVFEVIVMQEREILLEKIRAILTREKARDLYDLYYLTQRKIVINKEDVQKKLNAVKINFNKKELEKAFNKKEMIWETELKPLVKNYPKFSEITKQLTNWINSIN